MKVVILAGGMPSTISDERDGIPKPMAEIGGKPLLWHIMKTFSAWGLREFIVCGGYKVEKIKEYFMDYYIYESDITVDLRTNQITIHKNISEDWKVTVVDTGLFASTGRRVASIAPYVDGDFIVSYGDCLSDIDVSALESFHRQQGRIATMAVARPTGRNRVLALEPVAARQQAEIGDAAWANACIFMFQPKVFDYLLGNYELEELLLGKLCKQGELAAYRHQGFWIPVETRRDAVAMENLWNAGMAPWKIWK